MELLRSMPFAGCREEEVFTTGMLQAARQSVQDSLALHRALTELRAQKALPGHLAEVTDAALTAVERLRGLRESWMRHRPAVEEMPGVSGVRLQQRIERGLLPGVDAPGPWPEDEEAMAAMQVALLPLEHLQRDLVRTGAHYGVPPLAAL